MANTSFPKGLFPVKPTRGTVQINYYRADTAAALYLHQPVTLNSNGKIIPATCGSGNAILGSAECFLRDGLSAPVETNPYLPAATTPPVFVGVADDPNQEFMIEEDTGGSALALTNVGNLADFTYLATTGNTTTGLSNAVLDRSGVQTDSGQFLLKSLLYSADGDNDYGNYAKWVVRINEHFTNIQSGAATGGV